MNLAAKFHCFECGGSFASEGHHTLICTVCNMSVPLLDGIADFVRGRFDTTLNATDYDVSHGIDDRRPSQLYNQIRIRAGDRWPVSLGSVIEVGCGTGLYSRALIAAGEARDVVFTDISLPMLRQCRGHLERLGLLSDNDVAFATYSTNELCLRDVSFDTVVGTSVLHHILDVRSFLTEIYRSLRPGGVAFFLEPARRYHRALAQSLAEVAAHLLRQAGSRPESFQSLLNWLAQQRQSLLHHGDYAFLGRLEDKHQFVPEEFSGLAFRIGFYPAEAIPFDVDLTGIRTAHLLCGELGMTLSLRDLIAAKMPVMGSRFLETLGPQDRAPSFLLWLRKPNGPETCTFCEELEVTPTLSGVLSTIHVKSRWQIAVVASRTADGTILAIRGWYLSVIDVVGIRVCLDGVAQDIPTWLPRPDVQQSINALGNYPAWNALCCGIEERLNFQTTHHACDEYMLELYVRAFDGTIERVPGPDRIHTDGLVNFVG